MDHADSCGKSPNADLRSGSFNLAGPGAVAGTDYDEIGGDIHRCRPYLNKVDRSGNEPSMIDPFGRTITYLRVSVTDRCDFRCVHCMAEEMTFLPKSELLTLEELDPVCSAFVRLGVRKLRAGLPELVAGFVQVPLRGPVTPQVEHDCDEHYECKSSRHFHNSPPEST